MYSKFIHKVKTTVSEISGNDEYNGQQTILNAHTLMKGCFPVTRFSYARKSLNLSKINTNSNFLNKYKLNHIEN